jgi:hypothetical protein
MAGGLGLAAGPLQPPIDASSRLAVANIRRGAEQEPMMNIAFDRSGSRRRSSVIMATP